MKEPPPAKNFIFPLALFFLAFFSAVLCSCSEDPVDLAFVQYNLILDWNEADKAPEARLSVFAEMNSNVRRLESISVQKDGYFWTIDSPLALQGNGKQWAGSSHLEPPPKEEGAGGAFPQGQYFVECVDAAGKKADGSFNLSYNADLLAASADRALNLFPSVQKRVAVYSDANELLYFDTRKDNWIDDDSVFKGVKNSSFFRESFLIGNILCLMPKIYKNGEKSDGLD